MINRCRTPERAILAAVATAEGTALSSVDRALRLLEELARHGPLGATELANRTGCAKATAFRLARTLQARGFVVQNQDSTYRLGPRCLLLATGVHTSFDVRREALPAMEALRDETGETVQLTVLEGADVVYVEQVTVLQAGALGRDDGAARAGALRLGRSLAARAAAVRARARAAAEPAAAADRGLDPQPRAARRRAGSRARARLRRSTAAASATTSAASARA